MYSTNIDVTIPYRSLDQAARKAMENAKRRRLWKQRQEEKAIERLFNLLNSSSKGVK